MTVRYRSRIGASTASPITKAGKGERGLDDHELTDGACQPRGERGCPPRRLLQRLAFLPPGK